MYLKFINCTYCYIWQDTTTHLVLYHTQKQISNITSSSTKRHDRNYNALPILPFDHTAHLHNSTENRHGPVVYSLSITSDGYNYLPVKFVTTASQNITNLSQSHSAVAGQFGSWQLHVTEHLFEIRHFCFCWINRFMFVKMFFFLINTSTTTI